MLRLRLLRDLVVHVRVLRPLELRARILRDFVQHALALCACVVCVRAVH